MYAQLVQTDGLKSAEEMTPEERAFQERIDRGEKIEPKEWMPEGYRKTLIRQIGQHAQAKAGRKLVPGVVACGKHPVHRVLPLNPVPRVVTYCILRKTDRFLAPILDVPGILT